MPYFRLLFPLVTLVLAACQTVQPKQALEEVEETPRIEWLVEEGLWHCYPLDEYAYSEEQEAFLFPPSPEDSLWPRLQAGLTLPYVDNAEVNAQLNWYLRNPRYMERVQQRASRYMYHILETLHENDVPFDIALLPIVESAFEPFAYSHGQASGLWQFIPSTGKRFGLDQNWWYDGRRDAVSSTQAAMSYLLYLHRFFDGDWMHALAAYNSGEGTVRRAIRKNESQGKPTDFWHLSLPKETRGYVPKMIALAEIFRNAAEYEVELLHIPNKAYFVEVPLDDQLDLMQAAQLADISIDELYYLNPGFNRWATPPGDAYTLKVPVAAEEGFRQALADLPKDQRISWQRHIIASGESLNSIAKKYHSDIDWIKEINKLRSNVIIAGQTLMIPVASANLQQYRYSQNQRLDTKQNRAPANNLQRTDYIVKSGDSFWSIARAHKVEVQSLARWNNKAPRDTLHIGEKLVIWQASNFPSRQGRVTRINYRVRQGDSLAKIANKFKVTVTQITQWNSLDKNRYLQPGQRLTLHVNVMNTSH